MSPFFAPFSWSTLKRVDTAPKTSGCILGGTQEILIAVSGDLLGGTGKAEAAKLPGAGIGPKPCPGNERQKKKYLPDSGGIELRNRLRKTKVRTTRNVSPPSDPLWLLDGPECNWRAGPLR